MSGKHRHFIPRRRRRAVTVTVTSATLAAGGLLAGTASAAPDVNWDAVAACESSGNWAANGIGAWPVCGRHASDSAPATPAKHAAPALPKHAAPVVPAAPPASPVPSAPTSDYVVASGDTLAQIATARTMPGGWQQIYDNNRDTITDPNVLVIGQHLKLPVANTPGVPSDKTDTTTGAPAAKPGPVTTKGTVTAHVVTTALAQQGTPYEYGGNSPGGFDCSGLTQWIYKQVGIVLPRTAAAQSAVGHSVSLSELQPGDLLFFYRPVGHVVMYVGNGKIAEASQPGTPVRVRPMYLSGFVGARRIV
jgi:cell wall-associated NlpC family hydrolase